MQFEAKLKNKTYTVNVNETHNNWKVTLHKEGDRPELHIIPKVDFMELDGAISFLFEDSSYMVDIVDNGSQYTVYTRGSYRDIPIFNDEIVLHESIRGHSPLDGGPELLAGMPGKIVKIHVKEGDQLKQGEPILIMEAMKMENEIRASRDLTIKKILVELDENVEAGALMVNFK